ncbi:trypsin-like peptidase domain-containing protein [Acetobacter sp. LMG 32666]|uniref:trypsin-like peptidase domain-containing protein n=1 Tax=Acetobacter sp. LMG 32666 TaxID=2959295 RepID=UPI0030C858B7
MWRKTWATLSHLRCFNNGGTGFIVSANDKSWLVTCVHIVTGVLNTTLDAKNFNGASLSVLGTDIIIPLSKDGKKTFNVIPNPRVKNGLIDIMAVSLSYDQRSLLCNYESYDIESIVDIEEGQEVHIEGYAGINMFSKPVVSTISGNIIKSNRARFVINTPSIKGLSGGAVCSEQGLVGILYGNEGSDESPEAGVCLKLQVVKFIFS